MRKFLLALASAVVLFAANKVGHLSGDEVSKLVGSKDAVIVDVRVDEQFNEGHIKDAVHIPLKDIEANPGKFKDFDGKKSRALLQQRQTKRQSG